MEKRYQIQYVFYVPADEEVYGDIQTVMGEYDTYEEAKAVFEEAFSAVEDGYPGDGTYYDLVFIATRYFENPDDTEDEGEPGELLFYRASDDCPYEIKRLMVDSLCRSQVTDVPQI